MPKLCKIALTFTTLVFLSVIGIAAIAGWYLAHPDKKPLENIEDKVNLPYENVTFYAREDQVKLQGWFFPAVESTATVIIAHGYGNNRAMGDLPGWLLIEKLVDGGFNVLTFDFRNSGESEGYFTTAGWHEQRDLLAAVDYAKNQGDTGEQIGLLGYSMGAATSIIVAAKDHRVQAVVADSSFADLKQYLTKNLHRWTYLPEYPFNHLIMRSASWFTGVDPARVSPLEMIPEIDPRPILLIHGEDDALIPMQDSLSLYEAAGSGAQIMLVENAGHVESFIYRQNCYTERLIVFFQDSLKH